MIFSTYKILSILFSIAGIRPDAGHSAWYTYLAEVSAGIILIFFLLTFSSHIFMGHGTYSDYVEIVRILVSLSVMIVALFQRMNRKFLLNDPVNGSERSILTPSTIRGNHRKRRNLLLLVIFFLILDFIPTFSLHISENCSSYFLPRKIEPRELEVPACFASILCLNFIIDGIFLYSVAFFAHVIANFDFIHDEFYQKCCGFIEAYKTLSKSRMMVEKRAMDLSRIWMEYRQIMRMKRNSEKYLSLFPFIWLTGYFCQSYLCLMRASLSSGALFHRFFYSWTVFSLTTVNLVFIAFVADQSMRKDANLSEVLIKQIFNQVHESNLNLGLDEILFREDVFRISHVPLTVLGLTELKLSILPIFFSVVLEMVVMGYQELSRFSSLTNSSQNCYSKPGLTCE